MATVTVRQATPDDATELARMLDLFDRMGATPEQVAARMRANSVASSGVARRTVIVAIRSVPPLSPHLVATPARLRPA